MHKKGSFKAGDVLIGILIFGFISLAITSIIINSQVNYDIPISKSIQTQFEDVYSDAIVYQSQIQNDSDTVLPRDADADSSLWSRSWKVLDTISDTPETVFGFVSTVQLLPGFSILPPEFYIFIIAFITTLILLAVAGAFRGFELIGGRK